MIVRHPERHEASVGVTDEVDAVGIDGEQPLHLIDDRQHVAGVIDGAAGEVAAGLGRVPETRVPSRRLLGSVGCHEEEAMAVHQVTELHVRLLPGAAGAVAMEENDEGRRRRDGVVGGHLNR